jgi:hypothetical protein
MRRSTGTTLGERNIAGVVVYGARLFDEPTPGMSLIVDTLIVYVFLAWLQ